MNQHSNEPFLQLVTGWVENPFRLAIVGDTHVPDRLNALHPNLLSEIKALHPHGIIHTGDSCTFSVLQQFSKIAPLLAVRGNRDWFATGKLPLEVSFVLHGVKITCLHGHDGWLRYFWDKLHFLAYGYDSSFYISWLQKRFPDSGLIIFGHTHICEIRKIGNQQYVNPGSVIQAGKMDNAPTCAFLQISPEEIELSEIRQLSGWARNRRNWKLL